MDEVYNEDESIRLLAAGNVTGFQQIYKRYAYAIERFAFKFLKSSELSEDCVQEVFSSVWINREKFTTVKSLESYLYGMCANKAKDFLKAYNIRKLNENEYARTQRVAGNNVMDHLLDEECRALMQKAIDRLPATQRQVFELVTKEGLSHNEIAKNLGYSIKTVNNSMTAALHNVKTELGSLITLISISAL
jgi:RNA polymerase sigma-70 factor (family 1)